MIMIECEVFTGINNNIRNRTRDFLEKIGAENIISITEVFDGVELFITVWYKDSSSGTI